MRPSPIRRERLRLLRVPRAEGPEERAAFDPPLLSVCPRTVSWIDAADALVERPVSHACEELWYVGDEGRIAARLEEDGRVHVERVVGGAAPTTRSLVYIPLGPARDEVDGVPRYVGRWEHGKDRAVLSPSGAGLLLADGTSLTVGAPPQLVDVVRGDGLLLALRAIPNGARVLAADGVEVVTTDDVLSDIAVPEVERGPAVEVHPREAALAGFARVGFRASFGGLPFASFTRALGDQSADLARFAKTPRGVAWAAVRPLSEAPEDRDAYLERALRAELTPAHTIGRARVGKAGTIALSDGRRFRARAATLERLPKGSAELLVAALLDVDGHAPIALRVAAPLDALADPTPTLALSRLNAFLIAFHAWT